MRATVFFAGLAAWVVSSGAAIAANELVEKACKAYGKADAVSKAKTLTITGVSKYGGGVAKYDLKIAVRFPSEFRRDEEGIEGTSGSEGRIIRGKEGWMYVREAFRRMAPDEVEETAVDIRDVDWLGRLQRGEQKCEPAGDQKFEDVECSGLKLVGDAKREVTLWFDKSTGLLHRRDEAAKAREGGVVRVYTVFEEYLDFEGLQVATVRTSYIHQRNADTMSEKFELYAKERIDEFHLDAEVPPETFQAPDDPFAVDGLSGDAAKQRAEQLAGFFKGRRDPSRAAWAIAALARLKADAEIQALLDAGGEMKYFGCAARIRMGKGGDVPEEFRASEWRKKVAAAQGVPEGKGRLVVKFVGSAGVALQMGGAAVFIDAFYQPGIFHTPFPALDPVSVTKADALLFTNARRDHFCPWVTAKVLAQTRAKAFGPPAVIALLRENGVPDAQLQEVNPGEDKPVALKAGSVDLTAWPVAMAGEPTKEGKPDHVAWIVSAGGVKVLHLGLAGEPKGLDEEAAKGADLVFAPRGMFVVKQREFFLKLKPRYLVPTRVPDSPGDYGSLKGLRDQYARIVPMLPGEEAEF